VVVKIGVKVFHLDLKNECQDNVEELATAEVKGETA
jgi:hypothetical protein